MPTVRIHKLTKRFGDTVAVNDLSLDIKDGEFMAMLGPSGCGKTTTLRCIAGLERPDEGEIYIGDELVNNLPSKDRDVAMVFQFYAMYPGMNVFDQIAFPLKMRKVPKDEIKRQVRGVAERVGIAEILSQRVSGLAMDQKQRVALARAIVRRPKVYLLDEPLTNLDATLRGRMRAELKRLQKDLGTTTIFVTHDQLEAITLADRVAVMNLGRVTQYDYTDVLYEKPKNLFVASFIGTPAMNFVDGNLVQKDGESIFNTAEFKYNVSELRELVEPYKDSTVILGIRPEYTGLTKDKVSADSIKAKVDVVEPTGDRMIVSLKVGPYLFRANTRRMKISPGDAIWMTFDRDRIHLFGKDSGEAII